MKRGILALVFIAWFCFLYGCGSNTDQEKPRVEKDRIEKVGDASSTVGYDGKAIEKGLREVNDLSEDREKAADDIFNE